MSTPNNTTPPKAGAVIFDMDGVIFDTERLIMEGWQQVAREQGLENIDSVCYECIGTNAAMTIKIMKSHYGEDFPYEQHKARVRQYVAAHSAEGMPQKSGVRRLLRLLREGGVRLGLASSTRTEQVIALLSAAGLIDYFDKIVGGDMVARSKPAPDIFLKCAQELSVQPSHTLVIEDSPHGIAAAHAAGMRPIMVPDLLAPTAQTAALCCHIFSSLDEVADNLPRLL